MKISLFAHKNENKKLFDIGERKERVSQPTSVMPETTSKDVIIGREDSFPCKNIQFYHLFFSYI